MINWAYVAGFFDGEGSTYVKPPAYNFALVIVQSEKTVLECILNFFAKHGIIGKLYSMKPTGHGKKLMWRLVITKRTFVVAALRGMLPYLHVKRVLVQDIIRYDRTFPALGSGYMKKLEKADGHRGNRVTSSDSQCVPISDLPATGEVDALAV